MNGFGFIEYKDALDARDVVPGKSHVLTAFNVSTFTDLAQLSVSPSLLCTSPYPISRDINFVTQMERHY